MLFNNPNSEWPGRSPPPSLPFLDACDKSGCCIAWRWRLPEVPGYPRSEASPLDLSEFRTFGSGIWMRNSGFAFWDALDIDLARAEIDPASDHVLGFSVACAGWWWILQLVEPEDIPGVRRRPSSRSSRPRPSSGNSLLPTLRRERGHLPQGETGRLHGTGLLSVPRNAIGIPKRPASTMSDSRSSPLLLPGDDLGNFQTVSVFGDVRCSSHRVRWSGISILNASSMAITTSPRNPVRQHRGRASGFGRQLIWLKRPSSGSLATSYRLSQRPAIRPGLRTATPCNRSRFLRGVRMASEACSQEPVPLVSLGILPE